MDLKETLHLISLYIGLVGICIIIYGVILMIVRLVRMEIGRASRMRSIFNQRNELRHQLGSYLLLGLEFMIAADIIGTFTHPTLNDMAILGSIVAIRTVISIFIDKEMEDYNPAG